ncbi:MAG: hypothetical protein NUV94_05245, partial [Candidatus Acetothermia bacterium]|nr:hypothetical protein [Candidatus Acetothermia bacterium]
MVKLGNDVAKAAQKTWFGARALMALALLLVSGTTFLASAEACSNYKVEFREATFDGTNTTFNYRVYCYDDPAISHWVMGFPSQCADCKYVVGAGPYSNWKCGTDPTTGVYGVKFDVGIDPGQYKDFWIKLSGYWPTGSVQVAVKAGTLRCYYEVLGPACPVACNVTVSVTPTSGELNCSMSRVL